nr:MAG TPA: hypothetical protein [Caudoviricetes sp.]
MIIHNLYMADLRAGHIFLFTYIYKFAEKCIILPGG